MSADAGNQRLGCSGWWKAASAVLVVLGCLEPAAAVAVARPESFEGHCVVVLENSEVLKEVGSVWVSHENPCAIHACEVDDAGQPREIVSAEDCGQIYCGVDSELRPQEGSCCGACVRTKCLFNETVYEVGQTWHNDNDCTLLECARLPNGAPMINAYQKACPPLPPDCAPENVLERDCCPVCRGSAGRGRADEPDEAEETWTEEFYSSHPCARECRLGEPPMTCRYTFVVEWYETLSKACFDCPRNGTDCRRPHCVVGDGVPRTITVVNRMMPGPSLEVCQDDLLVVDVKNHLLGDSTTIHWHGMHQRETPYMDGVPHISQCPISPHSTFRYTFRAANAGTHFWHSHTGMQRGDGVFGALIVRRPKLAEPHGHLYDFDLPEHKMILQDWVHVPGVSMFASHHHSRGDNKPMNVLLNGKGRYYKAIWERIQLEEGLRARRPNGTSTSTIKANATESPPSSTEQPGDEQPVDELDGVTDATTVKDYDADAVLLPDDEAVLPAGTDNEIPRLARMLPSNRTDRPAQEAQTPESAPPAPAGRPKRDAAAELDIPLDKVPLQRFNVQRGFRYRMRVINAEFLNCPIRVSIDNHTLTAINSDGYDFEPVEVGSIVTYAGERFDFVLNANRPVGNYWIRLKGLMDCDERFTSAFQVGVLHYEGAPEEEPSGELGYQHEAEGVELNVMNRGPGHADSLTIAELKALEVYDSVPGLDHDALKPEADYKFFVYYDFYAKDNPVFHPAGYYGFNESLGKENRLYTPQLNHISLQFPPMALLPARFDLDDAMFCNETSLAAQGIDCRKEFCKCHHMLQVPLNAVVEFVIVDEGFTFDANHPFHLHGNAFRVVGLERLGANVTVEMVKQLDRYNLLKRNLVRPPVKDTVTVPDGGYTIVRFEAYNPGFWLFHCHIEFHAEIGMALILKVGGNDQMEPVPKNFPTCNDYTPDLTSAGGSGATEGGAGATVGGVEVTTEADRSGARSRAAGIQLTMLLLALLWSARRLM